VLVFWGTFGCRSRFHVVNVPLHRMLPSQRVRRL